MRRRIERRAETPKRNSENNVVANEAQAIIPTASRFDEQAELGQVNVLYSFLENRYSQKVCIVTCCYTTTSLLIIYSIRFQSAF